MIGDPDRYTTKEDFERLAEQAKNVWLVALLLLLLWLGVMAAAPLLASTGAEAVAFPIYKFFSFICHQQSDRSLHIFGKPLAVCTRCFGVYFGLLLGCLIYPLFRKLDEIEPPSRIWLILASIPIGLDWTLGVLGIVENTHFSRFITGAILGTVCAVYLLPAMVEMIRILVLKRFAKAG